MLAHCTKRMLANCIICSEQLECEEIVLYVVGTENVSTLYDI